MSPSAPVVLVCGEWQAPDQVGVQRFVRDRKQAGDGRIFFAWRPGGQLAVDVLLICLSHPDEYSAQEICVLLDAYPLAQIVCSAGRWCASAARTRGYWPPAVIVPADDAWDRLGTVWSAPDRRLAITASREELIGMS